MGETYNMKIQLETNIPNMSDSYLQNLVLLYRPCESFGKSDSSEAELFARVQKDTESVSALIRLSDEGKCEEAECSFDLSGNVPDGIDLAKVASGRAFLDCAERIYGVRSPFGIMTGIRPAKLVLSYLEKGYSAEEVLGIFTELYGMEESKASVLLTIAEKERSLLHSLEKKSFSLYLSIPFCPTRCHYCSFVSTSTKRLLAMIPDYLVRLAADLETVARTTSELGLSLSSVYVGGGTPSVLTAEQTEFLLGKVTSLFSFTKDTEFTFEAGRPDTVTKEKLRVLRSYGVGRISINTQTANDEVLRNVGRQHTFADYLEKMEIARKAGFDSINTDLIAGLPGESVESFENSLCRVIDAGPENVTVHSLTLKKSSDLKADKEYDLLRAGIPVRKMLDFAEKELAGAGYGPYYLYRQKNTVGNLENTGYAKAGKECFYNIVMMEEFHSVFSAGAGAVTKLVSPDRTKIERLFNQKYPYEYLGENGTGLDTERVRSFYAEHFRAL